MYSIFKTSEKVPVIIFYQRRSSRMHINFFWRSRSTFTEERMVSGRPFGALSTPGFDQGMGSNAYQWIGTEDGLSIVQVSGTSMRCESKM